MALTALKSVRLEDAGLVAFFDEDETRFLAIAKNAYAYTAQFVEDTGEDVRPDDLIPVLVPALEVDEQLREYLDGKKLPQKYWFTNFGELIVDRVWDDLTEEEEDDDDEED